MCSSDLVQALIKAMPGSPRAAWAEAGYVRLPVNFAGTRHERVSWDIAVKTDLRLAKGVQFDFYCADLAPFASFSLYFRSGGGWYHASFSPERVGAWHRIVIDKADTRIEGGGAGWGQVDTVRVSGWRCRDEDTVCAIANLGPAGGKPEVLVVRAESSAAKGGGEARAFGEYAGTVSTALERIGVAAAQVADTDLTPELLEGVSLAVLPYNPSVPKETLAHLKAFTGRGGKLLACYSLTPEVGGLLLSPCDQVPWPAGPPRRDPAMLELLAEKLAAGCPPLAGLPIKAWWAGLRTLAPDGRFAIGPDPRLQGFFWVAGLGGHGMTGSAAAGDLAAALLVGEVVDRDLARAVDPARLARG